MTIFTLLLLGAITGWLANKFVHTPVKTGLLDNIVLGMLGSIVGGWIMSYFGKPGIYGFNLYSIFVGVIGAVALVVVVRMFRGD